MTDKPLRRNLEAPLDHELSAEPGDWKFRCISCHAVVNENPNSVCEKCGSVMERITSEGGDIEAYQ